MTKYTFNPKNNPSTFYCPFYKSTNYSKVLDDLIASDIAEKNPWLYGYNNTATNTCSECPMNTKIKIKIKDNSDNLENAFIFGNNNDNFTKAYNFLTNLAFKCPFEKNKVMKLSNGDYIMITDDYIHINDQIFYFNLMDDSFFYNLGDSMKKTIATIYTDGLKITIKK